MFKHSLAAVVAALVFASQAQADENSPTYTK